MLASSLTPQLRAGLRQHRRFVAAIAVDSVGTGVFIPVSVLYFLAATRLSLVEIGAALTIGGLAALPAGPLAGGLVDRYGARRVLQAANLAQAIGFAGYLAVGQVWGIVVCAWLNSAGRAVFFGCYGVTVTSLAGPGQREQWFGLLGSVRNLGYAVGGLLASAAIGAGTRTAYSAIVAVNALSYVAAFILLRTVPDRRPDQNPDGGGGWGRVVRDGRYLLLVAQQLCFAVSLFALNIAVPVYVTRVLNLPGWTAGAAFTLNTLMVGFGQGPVAGRLTGQLRSRVLIAGHLCFAAGYAVLLSAATLGSAGAAVTVVLLGVAVYTLGEILGGPVTSAIAAEAAPAALRGRYLALNQLAISTAGAVAPVVLSGLLTVGAADTWLPLAGVALLGVLLATAAAKLVPAAGRRIGSG
jgi:MFS family permease